MFTASKFGTTDYWRGEQSQSRLAEELALPADEQVPYEARAAVSISAKVAESLIRHYRPDDDKGFWFGSLSDAIGWDLHRMFGNEGGFDLFDTCRWEIEGDDDEEAAKRDWPSFNRERQPSDVMLIDLADEASSSGWEVPTELAGHIEHLRTIADKRRSERDKARDAACDALDDALKKEMPPMKRELCDFYAHIPSGKFIYAPTGQMVNAETLNRLFPKVNGELLPATFVSRSANVVDDMTWMPGEPQFIEDRYLERDGWIQRPGCRIYNLYQPARIAMRKGDSSPLVGLVQYLFPRDWKQVIEYMAFKAQHPGVKINHALVLGSDDEGIGKDSILQPLKYAIGSANFAEVSIEDVAGRFNSFWQSADVLINEARDTGDQSKYALRNKLKRYLAAPPNSIHIDEKNRTKYFIPNVCGVVITTNYKDSLYLASGDRRYFVAWSDRTKSDFRPGYFDQLHTWLQRDGGYEICAHYLMHLDVSGFNPKAPPPLTEGFRDIVDTSTRPETIELLGVIENLGNPPAVTLTDIINKAPSDGYYNFRQWLHDHRNRTLVPHRMKDAGYVSVRNPKRTDGLWKVKGKPQVVYVLKSLTAEQRAAAAASLTSVSQ